MASLHAITMNYVKARKELYLLFLHFFFFFFFNVKWFELHLENATY